MKSSMKCACGNRTRFRTSKRPFASPHFERSVELPPFVGGVKIVRRDEDLKSKLLRGFKDALHIFNGVVFVKTLAEQRPSQARFAQYFILRIDHYNCGVVLIEFHNRFLYIQLKGSDCGYQSLVRHSCRL